MAFTTSKKTSVMVISTPEIKPISAAGGVTGPRRFSKFLGKLAPLPRLACDLAILSMRLTLAVLVASIRLIIPAGKKSLLGETVLVHVSYVIY